MFQREEGEEELGGTGALKHWNEPEAPTASPLYLRAHRALHVLWTRHAKTPGYFKPEWTELLTAIDEIEAARKRLFIKKGGRVIEGLKVDFTTDQLREHLTQRVTYHKERATWYQGRVDDLKEGVKEDGSQFNAGYSNANPVDALTVSKRGHDKKARFFQVVADHLIPDEIYRLEDGDLQRLEISDW